MKALLLYPEFPDTFWSLKHALKFIRKKASLPPLGLLTVAAMLPGEWAKRLVDVNVRPLREKDIAWADVVLISAMIAQRDSAVQLIARCRAAGKTIVAGGPLFTIEHAHYRPKPQMAGFARLLSRHRLDPARCVMVEDSAENLQTAKRLGMKTVWVSNTLRTPVYVDVKIRDVLELPRALARLT